LVKSAAFSTLMVPAFCVATWHQSVTLALFTASVLLWLVPIHPRWWARQTGEESREEASPASRSAADITLILGCWLLASWGLWQHRILPLVVCAVAAVLVLIDVASRPASPPPLCVPERSRRRRGLDAGPQLQA
jgi:hypothetical protein